MAAIPARSGFAITSSSTMYRARDRACRLRAWRRRKPSCWKINTANRFDGLLGLVGSMLKVLGIESSCDETGLALVQVDDQTLPVLLAHALHSQIEMHQAYGGVVPELASRDHIRRVLPLTRQVLTESGCVLADLDVVAFTRGPGLAGAL